MQSPICRLSTKEKQCQRKRDLKAKEGKRAQAFNRLKGFLAGTIYCLDWTYGTTISVQGQDRVFGAKRVTGSHYKIY